jgi:hypothetical protein
MPDDGSDEERQIEWFVLCHKHVFFSYHSVLGVRR